MQLHARKTLPMNSAFTPWTIEDRCTRTRAAQRSTRYALVSAATNQSSTSYADFRTSRHWYATRTTRAAATRRRRFSTCSTTSGRRSTRPSLYRRARRSTGFAASQRCLPYPVRLHARVIIRRSLTTSESTPSQTRISPVIHHPMITTPPRRRGAPGGMHNRPAPRRLRRSSSQLR